jgi:hypothetical protein
MPQLLADGERLLVVYQRFTRLAKVGVGGAEIMQAIRFTESVFKFAPDGEGALQAFDGLLGAIHQDESDPHIMSRTRFACPIVERASGFNRLLIEVQGILLTLLLTRLCCPTNQSLHIGMGANLRLYRSK